MPLNGGTFPVNIVLRWITVGQAKAKQFRSDLQSASVAAVSARKNFANLAGAFTGLYAARAVGNVFKAIVGPAAKMQTALSRLSVLTDTTGKKLDAFRQKAMEVAGITSFGPVKLTETLLRLRQVTGDATQAMKLLKPTAQLAMASFGKLSIEKATEMMGFLVKGFGLQGDQAVVGAQRVFTASKLLGVGVENFAQVMDQLATARRIGGQSFDQTIVAFGLLSREWGKATMAATGLRRAMQYLLSPEAQETLAGMGMIAQSGKNRQPLPLSEIVSQLAIRWQHSTTQTRELINKTFGMRGGPAVAALVGQLVAMQKKFNLKTPQEAWKYIAKTMQTSTQDLQKASQAWLNTFEGQAELLRDELEKLSIFIGEQILPGLLKFAFQAKNAIKGLLDTIDKSPMLKAFLSDAIKFVAITAAVWALTAAFQGIFAIIGVVTANVMRIGAGLRMAAGAVAGAGGLVGGLTAAAGWIWTLSKRALVLYAIFKGIQKLWEVAKFEEAAGPRKGMLAQKILASKGTSAAEKDIAQTYLKGGAKGWLASRSMSDWLQGRQTTLYGGGKGTWKPWTTATPALKKLLVEPMTGMKKELEDSGSFMKNAMKEAAEAMQKYGELGKQAAKEAYDFMVLGSEKMDAVIKRLVGVATYEPPLVKMGSFYLMKKQLGKALTSVSSESDRTMIETAMRQATTAEGLIAKSQTAEGLTPKELVQLQHALGAMGATGQELFRLYGPGMMSRWMNKKFGKDVVKQVAEMSSAQNLAQTEIVSALRGGRVGEHQIPGWVPPMGGYTSGPIAGQQLWQWAGDLPKNQSSTLAGGAGGEAPTMFTSKTRALPMTGQSVDPMQAHMRQYQDWKDSIQGQQELLAGLNDKIDQVKRTLERGIPVEIRADRRDPRRGGQSVGPWGPSDL